MKGMDDAQASHSHDPCCEHSEDAGGRWTWYRKPLVWTSAALALLWIASLYLPVLGRFRQALAGYLRIIGMPILLGLILGGLLDHFVPREYISKFLAPRRRRTILLSVGLGLMMSACSHGILALSMELHKKGASGPAVVSFLLASPWANLPVTFLLVGFFGWKGLLMILAAVWVALSTGLVLQGLDARGWIEKNRNSLQVQPGFSVMEDIRRRWRGYRLTRKGLITDMKGVGRGIFELADMVLWWILLGILLASFASAFVPQSIFQRFLGPSVTGLFITLVAAALFEVCSEGTSPLAFEIYRQTGALGNAFAFLMGGVVTDYSEIGLVWMNVGRKTALWMMFLTLPQVFLLGWLFNTLMSG